MSALRTNGFPSLSASTLLGVISAGFEVVGAFLWFEQRDDLADGIP